MTTHSTTRAMSIPEREDFLSVWFTDRSIGSEDADGEGETSVLLRGCGCSEEVVGIVVGIVVDNVVGVDVDGLVVL